MFRAGNGISTKHAVYYMIPHSLKTELGIVREVRGIPPSVVENAVKHGHKTVNTKYVEPRCVYTYDNVTIITDISGKIIISLGRRSH